jgi:type III secretion protein T
VNSYLGDPIGLLVLVAITSLRATIALAMLPMFAGSITPTLVRGVLGIVIVLPVIVSQIDKPLAIEFEAWPLLILFLRESAVGVVIGLGYSAFVAGLQAVGEIIDHQTGLTFTQNLDPVHGNNVSVTSSLLQTLLFAVLMVSGFLQIVGDTLYLSYEVWPLGQVLPRFEAGIPLRMVAESSRLFSLALLLAGPVVLMLFVVDVGASMLNRAAPQFNIFTLTLSLKSMVGIFVLAAALPIVIERSIAVMRQVGATLRTLVN